MAQDPNLLGEELIRAVEQLAEAFAARSIRYAIVGGLATLIRGRPRFTQDVDVLLTVPQLVLPGLLEDLISRGFSLDVTTIIREFIQDSITVFRFGTVRIDWLKPVLPLYDRALADATEVVWSEGHPVRVASAEGVILTKMVAFRPQDQTDITTLLASNKKIDLDLIRKEWAPFAQKEPERTAWIDAEIARIVTDPGKPL